MIRGTKEWAVQEINCCIGCSYGCRYCYARIKALKNGFIASVDDWQNVRVIGRDAKREYPLYSGRVMFPSAHDIVPENVDACLTVLSELLAGGNQVLIVSKPDPDVISRICDEFDDYKSSLLFRFTITARDPDILAFWEPGAPGYRRRLDALKSAYDCGFETSVSVEPMLHIEDIRGLIDDLSPFVTHSIWLGLMNKINQRVEIDSARTKKEVERIERGQTNQTICLLYDRLNNNQLLRWKESIKKIVGLPGAPSPGLDM